MHSEMNRSKKSQLRLSLSAIKNRFLELADKLVRSTSSAEKVFTDVYLRRKWGVGATSEQFDSGLGSSNSDALQAYIDRVSWLAVEHGFKGSDFVDIGCGDFRVGSQLVESAGSYVGVDVVRPLVERNQRDFGSANVRFICADATRDPLPPGDVCFLRQVLQHLSNRQIASILGKLAQYKWVVVTEHIPDSRHLARPNLDKLHGADVRVYQGSGVFLEEPPFEIARERLSTVLEVPGTDLGPGIHPGLIRTSLYQPQKHVL
jgi:SAM-dependent methyltransferase